MFKNRWAPGCNCCAAGHVTVQVFGCSATSPVSGATVKLKTTGGAVLDTQTTNSSGLATLATAGAGPYTLAVSHPSYGAESESAYTAAEGDNATSVILTPCGVLPPTLHVSGTDGWSGDLALQPPGFVSGFASSIYYGSRLVAMTGVKYDPANPNLNKCTQGNAILCRVSYAYFCSTDLSGNMLGLTLQVYHNARASDGSWLHYEDVEKPSGDSTRCPSPTGAAEGGSRAFRATVANGKLNCNPLSTEHALNFDFGGGGSGTFTGNTGALMAGTITYTVTE